MKCKTSFGIESKETLQRFNKYRNSNRFPANKYRPNALLNACTAKLNAVAGKAVVRDISSHDRGVPNSVGRTIVVFRNLKKNIVANCSPGLTEIFDSVLIF